MASKRNKTSAEMGALGLFLVAAVLIVKFGLWAVLGLGILMLALSFLIYTQDHK